MATKDELELENLRLKLGLLAVRQINAHINAVQAGRVRCSACDAYGAALVSGMDPVRAIGLACPQMQKWAASMRTAMVLVEQHGS